MKLVVLGASGGCGRELVRRARERGHEVLAVVRPSTAFEHDGVRVVHGDVLDPVLLGELVDRSTTVVSALGLRRRSLFPWSRLVSPPDLMSRAVTNAVAAMKRCGATRIAVVSAGGVGETRARTNLAMRLLIRTSNLGVAYRDMERVEQLLRESGLDWLAARPTTLTNGPARGSRLTDRYRLTSTIPRADVATFLLDELERPSFSLRAPMIDAR